MYKTGLLLLTNNISTLTKGDTLQKILLNVKKYVSSTLYVHMAKVAPYSVEDHTSLFNQQPILSTAVFPFVSKFYQAAAVSCRDIDVNILVHNIGFPTTEKHLFPSSLQCILCDMPSLTLEKNIQEVQDFVSSSYGTLKSDISPNSTPLVSICGQTNFGEHQTGDLNDQEFLKQNSVVLGGTFDNIHIGHKILLTEALIIAKRKLVIGVSSGPLLQRKTLKELIFPFDHRMKSLHMFLNSIGNIKSDSNKSGIDLNIVQIDDPFGPSIVDPDLQVIVVSKETEKGGSLVNAKRKEGGLNLLHIHVINDGKLLELASDDDFKHMKENKISSSTARFNKLGTLLKPNKKDAFVNATKKKEVVPYVIGLTGGIASGKTSVAQRLAKLGASVIDCDKLGHVSYLPGTPGFKKVVEEFGPDIVNKTDGTIDRKALGKLVFADKSNLMKLNLIIWPEIERLAKEQISLISHNKNSNTKSKTNGHPFEIVFLDAAVLLEATWNNFCDEVWLVIVPEEEALTRLMKRNCMEEESAKARIKAQLSNDSRIESSNVVLSTLWEPSITQTQVENAWKLLHERLKNELKRSHLTDKNDNGITTSLL